MGRYKSLAKITGSWADIQLCADGTARNKSSLTKKKWRKSAKMKLSRESAKAFGGASASGGKIISQLPEEMRQLARGHAHNHIAAPLRRHIATTCIAPEAYTFEAALPALFRLDLSQNRILSPKVFIRTIGDPLQPTGIHIQGLRDAADAITPLPDHRLQFCLHFCFVEFPESRPRMDFKWYINNDPQSHQQPSSGWLQAELIPEAGITLALETPNPDEPQILFVGIEWRQVRNSSARKQRLRPSNQTPAPVHTQSASTVINNAAKDSPKNPTVKKAAELSKGYGILKIAALFRPTKDLDLPRPAFLRSGRNTKYRPTIQRRTKVNLGNMTPEQLLRTKLPTLGATNPNDLAPSKIGFVPGRNRRPARTQGSNSESNSESPDCQPHVPKIPAPPIVDKSQRHAATPEVDCSQFSVTPVVDDPQYTATPVVDDPQYTATPAVDGPRYATTPAAPCPQYATTSMAAPYQYHTTPETHRLQYPTTPKTPSSQHTTPHPIPAPVSSAEGAGSLGQPYTTARQKLDYTQTKSTHSAHIHHIICTYTTFRTNGDIGIWKLKLPLGSSRIPAQNDHLPPLLQYPYQSSNDT